MRDYSDDNVDYQITKSYIFLAVRRPQPCFSRSVCAVLQDNRSSGVQRAEDADGDELHAV